MWGLTPGYPSIPTENRPCQRAAQPCRCNTDLRVSLPQKCCISKQFLLPASLFIQYQALMPFNNPLPFLDISLNYTAKLSKPPAQHMLFLIFFSSPPNHSHYHSSKGPSTNNSASATCTGFNQRFCWVATTWDTSLTTSRL